MTATVIPFPIKMKPRPVRETTPAEDLEFALKRAMRRPMPEDPYIRELNASAERWTRRLRNLEAAQKGDEPPDGAA